jgi:hypothetical protein
MAERRPPYGTVRTPELSGKRHSPYFARLRCQGLCLGDSGGIARPFTLEIEEYVPVSKEFKVTRAIDDPNLPEVFIDSPGVAGWSSDGVIHVELFVIRREAPTPEGETARAHLCSRLAMTVPAAIACSKPCRITWLSWKSKGCSSARSRCPRSLGTNKTAAFTAGIPGGVFSTGRESMPTPGLSLVGFLEQAEALKHLRFVCVPAAGPGVADADLITEWNAARARLGAALANAGNPDIQNLPPVQAAFGATFMQTPWIAAALQQLPDVQLHMVEIDPLLAYQTFVDRDRTATHCQGLASPPTIEQLLSVCLPTAVPTPGAFNMSQVNPASQSLVITTPNHNLQNMQHGVFDVVMNGVPSKLGGVRFHESLPFTHVVRLNGRCFLHNGYHRAVGLRAMGATHIPCLFRDVANYEQAGVKTDGSTFPPSVFEAGNPPTLAHFAQGRAHDIRIRRTSRIIHVAWAQYTMPAE